MYNLTLEQIEELFKLQLQLDNISKITWDFINAIDQFEIQELEEGEGSILDPLGISVASDITDAVNNFITLKINKLLNSRSVLPKK